MWSCFPSLDSIVAVLGALRLGAVVVAVNPSATRSELAYLARDAAPSASVVDRPEQAAWIAVRRPRRDPCCRPEDLRSPPSAAGDVVLDTASPDDDALIVYTSGTTGEPKGAVHTHRSLLAGTQALRLAWGWQPDDRLILALPLFHVHGLCAGLFGTLTAGGSAIVFDRFSPALVLDAVAEARCSSVCRPCTTGWPSPAGRPSCRRSASASRGRHRSRPTCGGDSSATTTCAVLERYGMSETLLTLSNPLDGSVGPVRSGFPFPAWRRWSQTPMHRASASSWCEDPPCAAAIGTDPTRQHRVGCPDGSPPAIWPRWPTDGYFSIRGRRTELIITGRPQRVPRRGGGGAGPTSVGQGDRRGRAALRGVGRIRHRICRWSRWGPGY